jgi:hypothetical protein
MNPYPFESLNHFTVPSIVELQLLVINIYLPISGLQKPPMLGTLTAQRLVLEGQISNGGYPNCISK